MPFAPSPPTVPLPLSLNPDLPLGIACPELAQDAAICVGLSIDWLQAPALHALALRHTHPEEHARAARFLRAEDALRHLAGRMLLRRLASHYGGFAADAAMPLNAWGKPQPLAHLGCNLSHSGNQVWAALGPVSQLGIDVEAAVAPADYRDILRSFHPDEIAALLGSADAPAAMMRCWARKEAVAKAAGFGLSLPLNEYAVDCGSAAADWMRIAPQGMQQLKWNTCDLPLDAGYVGALALAGHCRQVTVVKHFCAP